MEIEELQQRAKDFIQGLIKGSVQNKIWDNVRKLKMKGSMKYHDKYFVYTFLFLSNPQNACKYWRVCFYIKFC